MSKRCGMAVIGVLAAMSLTSVPIASAATEVGSNCAANKTAPNFTFIQLAKGPNNPLPITVPSAGVVTQWKVNSEPFDGTVSFVLKALRSAGAPLDFQVIDESRPGNVHGGQNSFDTRIPVLAGDRFGLFGTPTTFYCQSASTVGEAFAFVPGNALFGSTQTFGESKEVQVPVSAIVETDADGDGYGDETQDKCPQSAAFQTECPVVVLDAIPLAKKGSVVVLVTTSTETPVTVSAIAKVAGKSKGAKSSAQLKLKGVTSTVKPGSIARITLPFSAKLKSELAALPAKRSLKLRVTASATNVAGQVATDAATVKLKGRGAKPSK